MFTYSAEKHCGGNGCFDNSDVQWICISKCDDDDDTFLSVVVPVNLIMKINWRKKVNFPFHLRLGCMSRRISSALAIIISLAEARISVKTVKPFYSISSSKKDFLRWWIVFQDDKMSSPVQKGLNLSLQKSYIKSMTEPTSQFAFQVGYKFIIEIL